MSIIRYNPPPTSKPRRIRPVWLVGGALILLAGIACNLWSYLPPEWNPAGVTPTPTIAPIPGEQATPESQAEVPVYAEVEFHAFIPEETEQDSRIFINFLDEVTGLALNAVPVEMKPIAADHYAVKVPLRLGSIIRYRYSVVGGAAPVGEHIGDGRPVRYRLLHIQAPAVVEDRVSRWTDTEFTQQTGRIAGQVTNAATGQPIPDLLVTAGGAHALTTADGSFLLEGLPPGVHNLVVYAMDGMFRTFQQGALVSPGSTTPAQIKIEPSHLVNVIFNVTVPTGTIPAVPIRLAGDLLQLGNTYADLSGGASTLASRMPRLSILPDGRYSLNIWLPANANIHYKYTLGDGFWNAERAADGSAVLRQIVVPEQDTVIDERIESWSAGKAAPVIFDITVPESTPPGDFVSLQLNPVFGWTAPLPMWRLSANRWAYVLLSPLDDLPGAQYRLCRNDLCGVADDARTPGPNAAGLPFQPGPERLTVTDRVEAWSSLETQSVELAAPTDIPARGPDFTAGVELLPGYQPTWSAQTKDLVDNLRALKANTLIFSPSWTFSRVNPPLLEPIPGLDPQWYDINALQGTIKDLGAAISLYPQPRLGSPAAAWWQSGQRDFSWWLVWFDRYRNFLLHHADQATLIGAKALIIGGGWVSPALPGGTLADGTPSGIPIDADERWRSLIAEVRGRYSGQLFWALEYGAQPAIPPFLDAVDQLYIEWRRPLAQSGDFSAGAMQAEAAALLESDLRPLQERLQKPFILAVRAGSYPGAAGGCLPLADDSCRAPGAFDLSSFGGQPAPADLQVQADLYQALLAASSRLPWITGFVSQGYYPPAALLDGSASIHGKPAQQLLAWWFAGLQLAP